MDSLKDGIERKSRWRDKNGSLKNNTGLNGVKLRWSNTLTFGLRYYLNPLQTRPPPCVFENHGMNHCSCMHNFWYRVPLRTAENMQIHYKSWKTELENGFKEEKQLYLKGYFDLVFITTNCTFIMFKNPLVQFIESFLQLEIYTKTWILFCIFIGCFLWF